MSKQRKALVISGASSGIGKATALKFLKQGYKVVNLSRRPCEIEGVVNISVDMTVEGWGERIASGLTSAIDQSDSISIVHNAAVLLKDSVADVTATDMRRVLELNVVAPATLNQLLLAYLGEGSSIIYIASTLGTKAVANSCSYVTSKHAVIGLMRATCQDLGKQKVHTAAVCPGFTDTEMLRTHIGTDAAVEAGIAAGITLERLIRPAEIADAIYFCAENPVINGSVFHANLGQVES